jgi:hypothetical protein
MSAGPLPHDSGIKTIVRTMPTRASARASKSAARIPGSCPARIPGSCPASDRHTSAGGRRFILRSLPLPDRSRRHVHSDRARPACSRRTQLRLSHTGVHHAPAGPACSWRTKLRLHHTGVHHAPAGPACSWPIQAGARRHTNTGAHPGRGSAAHKSRSPSRPGLDGAPIQKPIPAGTRRHTHPGAHPGRGSAAHPSRSPSRPGLDGAESKSKSTSKAKAKAKATVCELFGGGLNSSDPTSGAKRRENFFFHFNHTK